MRARGTAVRATRRDRRGIATFWLVAALVVLAVLVIGIALARQGTSTAHLVDASVTGCRAEDLAASAVEAAWADLAVRVNASGDPLFGAVRAPGARVVRELAVEALPGYASWAAGAAGSGLSFERGAVSCELGERRPVASAATRFEVEGRVRLSVRVHGRGGVVREVASERRLRVVLASSPVPYSGFTFWLDDARRVVVPAADRARLESLAPARAALAAQVARQQETLANALAALPESAGDPQLAALRTALEGEVARHRELAAALAGAALEDTSGYLAALTPGRGAPLVFTDRETMSLSELNLQNQVIAREVELDGRAREMQGMLSDLDTALAATGSDAAGSIGTLAAVTPRLRATIEAMDAGYRQLAHLYAAFAGAFQIRCGDEADRLRAAFAPQLARATIERRAAYRTSDIGALIGRLTANGRGLAGTVLVDGDAGALARMPFFAAFAGGAVLAVTGAVDLRGVAPAGDADRLAVLALGTASLSGTVRAAVSTTQDVELAAGGRLEGSLRLARLPEQVTEFTVVYDARYDSGIMGNPASDRPALDRFEALLLPVRAGLSIRRE